MVALEGAAVILLLVALFAWTLAIGLVGFTYPLLMRKKRENRLLNQRLADSSKSALWLSAVALPLGIVAALASVFRAANNNRTPILLTLALAPVIQVGSTQFAVQALSFGDNVFTKYVMPVYHAVAHYAFSVIRILYNVGECPVSLPIWYQTEWVIVGADLLFQCVAADWNFIVENLFGLIFELIQSLLDWFESEGDADLDGERLVWPRVATLLNFTAELPNCLCQDLSFITEMVTDVVSNENLGGLIFHLANVVVSLIRELAQFLLQLIAFGECNDEPLGSQARFLCYRDTSVLLDRAAAHWCELWFDYFRWIDVILEVLVDFVQEGLNAFLALISSPVFVQLQAPDFHDIVAPTYCYVGKVLNITVSAVFHLNVWVPVEAVGGIPLIGDIFEPASTFKDSYVAHIPFPECVRELCFNVTRGLDTFVEQGLSFMIFTSPAYPGGITVTPLATLTDLVLEFVRALLALVRVVCSIITYFLKLVQVWISDRVVTLPNSENVLRWILGLSPYDQSKVEFLQPIRDNVDAFQTHATFVLETFSGHFTLALDGYIRYVSGLVDLFFLELLPAISQGTFVAFMDVDFPPLYDALVLIRHRAQVSVGNGIRDINLLRFDAQLECTFVPLPTLTSTSVTGISSGPESVFCCAADGAQNVLVALWAIPEFVVGVGVAATQVTNLAQAAVLLDELIVFLNLLEELALGEISNLACMFSGIFTTITELTGLPLLDCFGPDSTDDVIFNVISTWYRGMWPNLFRSMSAVFRLIAGSPPDCSPAELRICTIAGALEGMWDVSFGWLVDMTEALSRAFVCVFSFGPEAAAVTSFGDSVTVLGDLFRSRDSLYGAPGILRSGARILSILDFIANIFLAELPDFFVDIIDSFGRKRGFRENIIDIWDDVWNFLKSSWITLTNAFSNAFSDVTTCFLSLETPLMSKDVTGFWAAVKTNCFGALLSGVFNTVNRTLLAFANDLGAIFGGPLSFLQSVVNTASGVIGQIKSQIASLITFVNVTIRSFVENLEAFIDGISISLPKSPALSIPSLTINFPLGIGPVTTFPGFSRAAGFFFPGLTLNGPSYTLGGLTVNVIGTVGTSPAWGGILGTIFNRKRDIAADDTTTENTTAATSEEPWQEYMDSVMGILQSVYTRFDVENGLTECRPFSNTSMAEDIVIFYQDDCDTRGASAPFYASILADGDGSDATKESPADMAAEVRAFMARHRERQQYKSSYQKRDDTSTAEPPEPFDTQEEEEELLPFHLRHPLFFYLRSSGKYYDPSHGIYETNNTNNNNNTNTVSDHQLFEETGWERYRSALPRYAWNSMLPPVLGDPWFGVHRVVNMLFAQKTHHDATVQSFQVCASWIQHRRALNETEATPAEAAIRDLVSERLRACAQSVMWAQMLNQLVNHTLYNPMWGTQFRPIPPSTFVDLASLLEETLFEFDQVIAYVFLENGEYIPPHSSPALLAVHSLKNTLHVAYVYLSEKFIAYAHSLWRSATGQGGMHVMVSVRDFLKNFGLLVEYHRDPDAYDDAELVEHRKRSLEINERPTHRTIDRVHARMQESRDEKMRRKRDVVVSEEELAFSKRFREQHNVYQQHLYPVLWYFGLRQKPDDIPASMVRRHREHHERHFAQDELLRQDKRGVAQQSTLFDEEWYDDDQENDGVLSALQPSIVLRETMQRHRMGSQALVHDPNLRKVANMLHFVKERIRSSRQQRYYRRTVDPVTKHQRDPYATRRMTHVYDELHKESEFGQYYETEEQRYEALVQAIHDRPPPYVSKRALEQRPQLAQQMADSHFRQQNLRELGYDPNQHKYDQHLRDYEAYLAERLEMNERQHEQYKRCVVTDDLTGLPLHKRSLSGCANVTLDNRDNTAVDLADFLNCFFSNDFSLTVDCAWLTNTIVNMVDYTCDCVDTIEQQVVDIIEDPETLGSPCRETHTSLFATTWDWRMYSSTYARYLRGEYDVAEADAAALDAQDIDNVQGPIMDYCATGVLKIKDTREDQDFNLLDFLSEVAWVPFKWLLGSSSDTAFEFMQQIFCFLTNDFTPGVRDSIMFYLDFIFPNNCAYQKDCRRQNKSGLGIWWTVLLLMLLLIGVPVFAALTGCPNVLNGCSFGWLSVILFLSTTLMVAYEWSPLCGLRLAVPNCLADDLFCGFEALDRGCLKWETFLPGIIDPGSVDDLNTCAPSNDTVTPDRSFVDWTREPYSFNNGQRTLLFLPELLGSAPAQLVRDTGDALGFLPRYTQDTTWPFPAGDPPDDFTSAFLMSTSQAPQITFYLFLFGLSALSAVILLTTVLQLMLALYMLLIEFGTSQTNQQAGGMTGVDAPAGSSVIPGEQAPHDVPGEKGTVAFAAAAAAAHTPGIVRYVNPSAREMLRETQRAFAGVLRRRYPFQRRLQQGLQSLATYEY